MAALRILHCATLVCLTGAALLHARDPDSSPTPARFLSWNLENYLMAEPDPEQPDAAPVLAKPEEAVADLVETLAAARPDLIGICEIGSMEAVQDLLDRLKLKGLDYPHTEWLDAADPYRHVALFSRFPIVERHSRADLVYRIDLLEFPVQRGILDVTVQIAPDYRLRCLGVHFKSKREAPEADQALMRRNEAHLLRLHVDSILSANPDENLLIFGDFNDTRNEVVIRAVQGRYGSPNYLRALDARDASGQTWTHYWDTADIYSRIDYLFASRELLPEIETDASRILSPVNGHLTSDHRPLVTEIMPVER